MREEGIAELRSDEGKTERLRALQARRSALIWFTDLTKQQPQEVGDAIRRITSEINELAPRPKVVK